LRRARARIKKRKNEVEIRPRRAAPVAAERNIKVVADKRRQRNVPAPPEDRDAVGEIRRVEIFMNSMPSMRARPTAMSE